MPIYRKPAVGTRSTQFLSWAALALRFGRTVRVRLISALQPPITQRFTLRTIIDILGWIIAKMIVSETAVSLVPVINDRNMGLYSSRQQPGEELAFPLCLVCPQALGSYPELLDPFHHFARRHGLLME